MDAKIYIFSLDYGKRSDEKLFIKEILRNFDKDTVVGCGIFVNNIACSDIYNIHRSYGQFNV